MAKNLHKKGFWYLDELLREYKTDLESWNFRSLRRISSHSWNHSQTVFSIEIGAKTMAAIITWLISFEKIWLRLVSAMTGNPPLYTPSDQIYEYLTNSPKTFD